MPLVSKIHGRMKHFARHFSRNEGGLALVEFAYSFPILMIMATGGLELANYILATRRISELAVMISDNASRMGAQSVINNKPVSEAEINDVFIGADMQAGGLQIGKKGRIILSSLQTNGQGGQTIFWQRCFGEKKFTSSYGLEGVGATGTSFAGMGPANNIIVAPTGGAVMVVEISYDYQSILPLLSLNLSEIHEIAAFNVRDSRDLTKVWNSEKVTPSKCT